MSGTVAITGANGNLGRRLLRRLAAGGTSVRGLVRSAAAVRTLNGLALPGDPTYLEIDCRDVDAMTRALEGCTQVVHLVGIIRETPGNRFVDAHQHAAGALVAAAASAGVRRIISLSILGANESAGNACLRSRGATDAILLAAPMDVVVIRVPMVLGEDDHAARALAGRARRAVGITFRAASLEQPIWAEDVVDAMVAALGGVVPGRDVLELAGPESLPRRALDARAARVLGRRTRTLSLPLGAGLALAGLLERISTNPPVTRAMLGVLDHDDCIDPRPAAARLGISLTPLDTMLACCLGAERRDRAARQ
jgi:NADH dehydrogenase